MTTVTGNAIGGSEQRILVRHFFERAEVSTSGLGGRLGGRWS